MAQNSVGFIAVIGLFYLSLRFHSPYITFNLSLLAWLLFFIYLLNKVSLAIDTYNLISSRFIFWLFFFSISITAAIVIQNSKKELEQRKHFAENIANRADPAGERIISVILSDFNNESLRGIFDRFKNCLLYTSPSPRDGLLSRMPSSA